MSMYKIRNAFITVLAILSLSAVVASCALDSGQSLGGDVEDPATVQQALPLLAQAISNAETQATVEQREEFDCVGDSNGIICTSERLDLVVWCDYESGKCGGGCLHCD